MKNENIYSLDKHNQYLAHLSETISKKRIEINQLEQNYFNIEKETQRREKNLREFIMHLNVKAYNRDYHLIKKNMMHLGSEINENINNSYYNGKTRILTNMHSVSAKNDVLLKESYYTHKTLLDSIEKQQGSTMVLFNKNYENNTKLKENYFLIKRKCQTFYDLVSKLKSLIQKKKADNIELFYCIYKINHLFNKIKCDCGVMENNYNFNLLYGNLIDLNLKNEYKINNKNIDTKNNHTNTLSKNNTSKLSNEEIINNLPNKSFELNNIKSFTKAKMISKILSNLLNILEYKKQINKKLVESSKINTNIYLNSIYNLILKKKEEITLMPEQCTDKKKSLNTINSSALKNNTFLNYYFISKSERLNLIETIVSNFEEKSN